MATALETYSKIETIPATARVTRCELERRKRGLSQEECAALIGSNAVCIARLEGGQKPGLSLAIRLQKLFGLASPEQVIEEV